MLEESGKAFETVEYLNDVPGIEEIKTILKKLKIKPHELIRTKEPVYLEKYNLACRQAGGKKLSDEQWIKAMHENPILMERPIVINGNKAVIARPPDKVKEIL